jgi:2'-5' RNA ligase
MLRMLDNMPAVYCILAVVAVVSGAAQGAESVSPRDDAANRILAIDIALEPDAKMYKAAVAANARLRENYPAGYTLGKEQAPHITIVQRYVRARDLDAIHEAVSKVCERHKPLKWELTATGVGYGVWSGLAITYINVEPIAKLKEFQQAIVEAVEPFAAPAGTAAAFSTTAELPKIQNDIIEYVKTFVPNASGEKYNPHVTFGVAREDYVEQMRTKPFEKFTFNCIGVADYQLGNFGTAQKKLWQWKTE